MVSPLPYVDDLECYGTGPDMIVAEGNVEGGQAAQ